LDEGGLVAGVDRVQPSRFQRLPQPVAELGPERGSLRAVVDRVPHRSASIGTGAQTVNLACKTADETSRLRCLCPMLTPWRTLRSAFGERRRSGARQPAPSCSTPPSTASSSSGTPAPPPP